MYLVGILFHGGNINQSRGKFYIDEGKRRRGWGKSMLVGKIVAVAIAVKEVGYWLQVAEITGIVILLGNFWILSFIFWEKFAKPKYNKNC